MHLIYIVIIGDKDLHLSWSPILLLYSISYDKTLITGKVKI